MKGAVRPIAVLPYPIEFPASPMRVRMGLRVSLSSAARSLPLPTRAHGELWLEPSAILLVPVRPDAKRPPPTSTWFSGEDTGGIPGSACPSWSPGTPIYLVTAVAVKRVALLPPCDPGDASQALLAAAVATGLVEQAPGLIQDVEQDLRLAAPAAPAEALYRGVVDVGAGRAFRLVGPAITRVHLISKPVSPYRRLPASATTIPALPP